MKKFIEIVIGLILLLGVSYVFITPNLIGWAQATKDFIQGGIVILVAVIGLALVLLGISELKG